MRRILDDDSLNLVVELLGLGGVIYSCGFVNKLVKFKMFYKRLGIGGNRSPYGQYSNYAGLLVT